MNSRSAFFLWTSGFFSLSRGGGPVDQEQSEQHLRTRECDQSAVPSRQRRHHRSRGEQRHDRCDPVLPRPRRARRSGRVGAVAQRRRDDRSDGQAGRSRRRGRRASRAAESREEHDGRPEIAAARKRHRRRHRSGRRAESEIESCEFDKFDLQMEFLRQEAEQQRLLEEEQHALAEPQALQGDVALPGVAASSTATVAQPVICMFA